MSGPQGTNDAARALAVAEGLRKDMDTLTEWKDKLEERYRTDRQWANDEHANIRKLIGETKDVLVGMIGDLRNVIQGMERALYALIIGSVLLPTLFLIIAHYAWK